MDVPPAGEDRQHDTGISFFPFQTQEFEGLHEKHWTAKATDPRNHHLSALKDAGSRQHFIFCGSASRKLISDRWHRGGHEKSTSRPKQRHEEVRE
eukprot:1159395-Pelagomonas_calceolata.AAC.6